MFTENLSVSNYNDRFYTVRINGSWITILDSKTKQIITKRSVQDDNWYDASHQKIVNAMYALEEAIFEMVDASKV